MILRETYDDVINFCFGYTFWMESKKIWSLFVLNNHSIPNIFKLEIYKTEHVKGKWVNVNRFI